MPSTNSARSPQLLRTIRVCILNAFWNRDGRGHLATVSVNLKSFNDITSLLTEIDSVLACGAEIPMDAVGLLREMTEPSFSFIAKLVHTVLALLDPPNKLLQREDTDLMTGLNIVASATDLCKETPL